MRVLRARLHAGSASKILLWSGVEHVNRTFTTQEAWLGAPPIGWKLRWITGDRPRLQDVASAAGVSLATASRALGSGSEVSVSMRQRVREAALRLGYMPHGAARALSLRRTGTIGAIVPSIEGADFARAIAALQHELGSAGHTLLLAASGYDPDEEAASLRALLGQGVDGMVLVGGDRSAEAVALLARAQVPFVQTWTLAPGLACVGFDNARAAASLTQHLCDLRHRRFAVIAGVTRHNDRAAARVAGVRSALAGRGLALPDERLIERSYRIEDGRAAMRALLGATPRPTAILCGNDELAFGALVEAHAQGVAIPAEVSVTGFNDLDIAPYAMPPLTTMRVPAETIGMRAGRYLLDRLAGREVPQTFEVEVVLVMRDSTGPAPAQDSSG